MTALFSYSTLETTLQKDTRSLSILLKRPTLSSEVLFELESVMAWCSNKVEIDSILLSSTNETFCDGWSESELNRADATKLEKMQSKLRRLVHAMLYLPQTVVVDLKNGATGAGLELSLGADIRIAHVGARMNWNQLSKGLLPASGGLSLLSTIVPKSFARNWIMGNQIASNDMLLASGFITSLYTEATDARTTLLLAIRSQAPVERMQCKNAMNQGLIAEVERAIEIESHTLKGSLATEDWKEGLNETPEFFTARAFAHVVKSVSHVTETANA